ncbi:MAG TPA: TIR domain-containing protein, partial [Propionicimonas sp.]|nr:TIR domain-containing protein [Propionicimonas sp.]
MTRPNRPPFDVFISHAWADSKVAFLLAEQLRRRGRRVFLAGDSLDPGVRVWNVIEDAIVGAAAMLILVSPESAKSNWVRLETALALKFAESGDSLLIPVLLPGADPADLPSQIAQFRGVSLGSAEDTAAALEAIDRSLAQQDRSPRFDQRHAASLLQRSLADSERVLGPDHPSTLSTRANLANVYLQLGEPHHAASLLQKSLADSERVLGPDHPSTLS